MLFGIEWVMQEAADWTVVHNQGGHRFEIDLGDGKRALLAYVPRNHALDLVHTGVPAPWERQGIAARLAQAALDYAREAGFTVIPSCPYVQEYLRQHREYLPLVDPAFAAAFPSTR